MISSMPSMEARVRKLEQRRKLEASPEVSVREYWEAHARQLVRAGSTLGNWPAEDSPELAARDAALVEKWNRVMGSNDRNFSEEAERALRREITGTRRRFGRSYYDEDYGE